ncbi:hypothetical protein PRIPAC_73993 [Pristionchus pacificus]|uniref:microsomal epoxide hydrolase n=1 Tax=Pristionchus pacificus TaxID=54126 RepID=A0A2A6CGK9_PRIPA|nr:hypothetical protein PRIPAC_73993 [Pristionchus pacificus]|eukprot:PDM77269.1 hydrolase [Pristionchus pacificus]
MFLEMGLLKLIIVPSLVAVVAFLAYTHLVPTPKPDFPRDGWFGTGMKRADDTKITPFKVAVPDAVLEDLKNRVASTRISHEVLEDANSFEYGFNANYLKKVLDHWQTKYDWRKQEVILNSWPQFITEVEGVKVHYYHAKPDAKKYKKVVPLLLVHGWPGNVFEFYKMLPMLLDPVAHKVASTHDIAFEVIAPSIPGYGFSESPKKTGFSQLAAARVFRKLMERVGHKKFYMQGGDWGSIVTSQLARMYPESALGLHLNMASASPTSIKGLFYAVVGSIIPQHVFKHSHHHDYSTLDILTKVMLPESGYMHIQATKPDTVGTGLNDSPAGLAAYILEKFSTWTNGEYRKLPDGGLTKKFTLDELLTIVTIYWTQVNVHEFINKCIDQILHQGNIVASQRFYKECFTDPYNFPLTNIDEMREMQCSFSHYISVPTAHAQFPNELFDKQPAEIIATGMNLTSQVVMPDGGHFAAFEHPSDLAKHLFSFVGGLEKKK